MSSLGRVPRYCAYLLRCWEAPDKGSDLLPARRYSLEDPHSGARRGFASLEALVAHLRAELGLDAAEAVGSGEAAGARSAADDVR